MSKPTLGIVLFWKEAMDGGRGGYGFIQPEHVADHDRKGNVFFNGYAARFVPARGDRVRFEYRDVLRNDKGLAAWKVEKLDDEGTPI